MEERERGERKRRERERNRDATNLWMSSSAKIFHFPRTNDFLINFYGKVLVL